MIAAVTGHRPASLGGYEPNPVLSRVRGWVHAQLSYKTKPDVVRTGMALGVDQIVAEECIRSAVPFVAVVPFRGQDRRWPDDARDHYHDMLNAASEVVVVCDGGYAAWKMHKRNQWLVDGDDEPADVLWAVWNGQPGGTASCVAYAEKRHVPIIRYHPR